MGLLTIIASRHRGAGFISLWETTGANETIQLPITNLYTIDWGDGNITTTETSHEYAVADQHTITIRDTVTDWRFNGVGDVTKILNISNWGGFTSPLLDRIFTKCSNLDVTANDEVVLLTASAYFRECSDLEYSTISNMDTSLVDSFFTMFFKCNSLNTAINFDTSLGTKFGSMLRECTIFNKSVNIDTSLATDMNAMFRQSPRFNQPINFDTPLVENMSGMFYGATDFDQPLDHLDYSSVTNISDFMAIKTDLNYSATYYDDLLIKWDNAVGGLIFANMTNVNIGMGTIKRTAAGSAAHASLISKGFIITDGGI
jgi:hypothetical protein